MTCDDYRLLWSPSQCNSKCSWSSVHNQQHPLRWGKRSVVRSANDRSWSQWQWPRHNDQVIPASRSRTWNSNKQAVNCWLKRSSQVTATENTRLPLYAPRIFLCLDLYISTSYLLFATVRYYKEFPICCAQFYVIDLAIQHFWQATNLQLFYGNLTHMMSTELI